MVEQGGRYDQVKADAERRNGCGWLVKLEPLGTAFSVDDVAHVGPWRLTRNDVVVAYARKVIEVWNRDGKAPEIFERMKQLRKDGEIRLVD
jgi:hypothetical protein